MIQSRKKRCVVLLSGGLDSATILNFAQKNFDVTAIAFDYGQRHKFELNAARKIAKKNSIFLKEIKIDLAQFGNSALTDNISVPKNQDIGKEIPITYVPVRNTIFLSYALAFAEVNEIFDIFIGVNALDYSGYPDCRPEFIDAFEKMANEGTKFAQGAQKIKIHTPLIDLTKAEIISKGIQLGVDYSMTHSCYDPSESGLSCGECDACILRKAGFKAARIMDPTNYQ
jgi:7-cyano-7-deazaguanine synthase|tara:strand:- start:233 stop:913 length:681 start_codon:yes stop_codon:yes gene_type:complete